MSFVASSGEDRGLSAREELAAATAVDVLETVYDRLGGPALALARALAADDASEQIVIDAFVVARRVPLGFDAAHDRRMIFASVVMLCEQRQKLGSTAESSYKLWAQLPRGHRAPLALAILGRCSLDEIAAILNLERSRAARALTDALRAAGRTRTRDDAASNDVQNE